MDVFIPEDYVRSRYRRTSSRFESAYSTDHKDQSHNGDFASNPSAASCTSTISDSTSRGGSSSVEFIVLNCLTP